MLNFPFQESSLKSLCSCHGELCFLVNNDSFHSSTAFSPVAERDRAEGKERERVGGLCYGSSLYAHLILSLLQSHTGCAVDS